MYAVIFKAEINAINKYGCKEFTSVTDGTQEIAISYWQNQEQIKQWKQESKHLVAQKLGQTIWYKSYTVQIVEVVREYSKNT